MILIQILVAQVVSLQVYKNLRRVEEEFLLAVLEFDT